MGFLDKAKLDKLKDQAGGLAKKHGPKISGGIDKAGDAVNKATKGKYAAKIDKAEQAAKGAVRKAGDAGGPDAPPPPRNPRP